MIEINIQDLNKKEIGTHSGPVQVKRDGKVHTEIRRLGKKPSRAGTGKMDALPQEIKDEILQLRNANTSGAEIKHIIENHIVPTDNDNEFIFIVENKDIRRNLQSKIDASKTAGSKALHEGRREEATKHDKEYKRLLGLVNTEIPISTSKVIGKDRKLKVTGQGITEWAKNQGVTARKKRQSAAEIRESIESKWKEDWHKVNVDKAKLETQVRELENDVKAQRSQKEGIQDLLSHCQSDLLQSKTK